LKFKRFLAGSSIFAKSCSLQFSSF
jgi:hypothetical protein